MRPRRIVAAAVVAVALVSPSAPRADSPATPGHPRFSLPFIDDDYPHALAEARARGVPIFAENWAPW